ncbi:MAG: hypothetical protein WC001_07555 [Desulfurivibrionaceae bacterium]
MSHQAIWKRKEPLRRLVRWSAIACLLFAAAACATGSGLRVVSTSLPPEDGRRYRLFLYGGIDSNDFESVAILDREDDRFMFVSQSGAIKVDLRQGLTISEAQAEARHFLGRNNYFFDMEPKAIIGPDGQVAGYEIRGLYSPSVGRRADDLDTTYLFGPDDTVTFYVYYPPEVGSGADNFPGLKSH